MHILHKICFYTSANFQEIISKGFESNFNFFYHNNIFTLKVGMKVSAY